MEDEFELVMGIFEKVTDQRTEYLHHVRSSARYLHLIYLNIQLYRVCSKGWNFLRFRMCSLTFSAHVCYIHRTRVDTSADSPAQDYKVY